MGYSTKFEEINLNGNMNLMVLLKSSLTLQQVDITASGSELLEQSSRMSSINIPYSANEKPAFVYGGN